MAGHGVRTTTTRSLISVLVTALALLGVGVAERADAVPPTAPVLVGPVGGASVTIPFTISWAPVSGAGGYNWELSNSSSFDPVLERNPVLLSGDATSEDVISGLPAGTYFWRVQAVSRDLEPGAWSPARSVVVTGSGSGVPGTATLDPPASTRVRPFENNRFSWSAVPGAVSYILQESTDPSFPVGTRVRQVNLHGTSELISMGSANQGSYQARVLAVNADGLVGAPSNLVSFSVSDTNPLPAPPVLQGPANGTTSQLPLTVSWSHVPNHQDLGYQVEVSSTSAFTTVEKSYRTSDNRLVVPTLSAGNKFWRVRSQHGYNAGVEAFTAWSATGTFTVSPQPLSMGAVTFPEVKFSGGETRGSIEVTGLAPAGGITIALSTDRPDLLPELPASRQIAGATSSSQVLVYPTGAINSGRGMRVGYVTEPATATVTATYNGTTATTKITVLPPKLNDDPFQLFPVKATGGADMQGIVDLETGCTAGFCDGLAPPGGFLVNLSSSSPAAIVPPTFTIDSPHGGDAFDIRTNPVTKPTHVTITAQGGGGTAVWTLTLTPAPDPASLSLLPASTTTTGSQGQIRIPLSEMQGYDQIVQVTSSNPAVASVPAFATISGSTEFGRFDIATKPVDVPTPVTISVTGRGVTRSATLTVSPSLPPLTGLSVNPTSVTGGSPSTGTVTLRSAAPSGGATVSLDSRLPGAASVPATVTVPAGATSATFPITTFPVDDTTVQLSATLGATSQFTALGITRSASVSASAVSLSPTTVVGGSSSTGTVTLSAAAPSGGTVVTLSDNSSAATVPASVTVAAGAISRTFTVTTSTVSAQTPVAVSAAAGGVTRSATLTLNPPTPAAPTLQSPANGATRVAQPATLDWNDVPNATGYEVLVDDTSSMAAPYVANPTVTASQAVLSGLPARQLWWRVRARNAAGVFGAFSTTRSFTPQAATGTTPSLSAVALSPTIVTGGAASTGTVTLTAAAPAGGIAVSLTSSNAAVTVPTSVTVPAGQASATFTAATSTVSAQASSTVTATATGLSRTATLTVKPPTAATLAAPSLTSPAVDARFSVGQNIVFDWSDVPGAASYTIAIDDQDTFASPTVLDTVTASTFSTSALPAARTWFRIRALDASGVAGAWSGPRRFEVR
jgi:hypothetical protein